MPILLEARGLKKHFPIKGGLFGRTVGQVKAVDGIDLFVREGETLGLVGESGCGKSTAGRTMIRLYEPTAGEIIFHDPERGQMHIERAGLADLRRVWMNMQMIFQDPFSSLDPRMSVGRIIGEIRFSGPEKRPGRRPGAARNRHGPKAITGTAVTATVTVQVTAAADSDSD
jgi:peptide/nickel transport system ATP-binding protein